MIITWIGHSCFKLETKGYTIITDPYEDGSVPGLKDVRETANLVLCSHEHFDHNGRSAVKIIGSENPPVSVTKIETWHDEVRGAKRGANTIYILDDGETRLAHLGDLGCELEPEQIEQLKGIDVLLVPVGGFYTINAEQAADLIQKLHPRKVIPMHYRSTENGFGFDVISDICEFIQRMENVTVLQESSIDTAACPDTQVIVLLPQNRLPEPF